MEILIVFFVFLVVCVAIACIDAMHSRWAMVQAMKEARAIMEMEERERKECQSTY